MSLNPVTDEEFREIYQSGKFRDPHAELANRRGIDRLTAKSLVLHKTYNFNPSGETNGQTNKARPF